MKFMKLSIFFCLAVMVPVSALSEEEVSPLHKAAFTGNLAEVTQLLDKGTAIDRKDSIKRTPLMLAAQEGRFEVALLLLERGAKPKVKDRAGNSLFHYAAVGGSLELLEHLKTLGLDYESKNKSDQTPYHLAIAKDHLPVLELFEKWGVNWQEKNSQGNTVLHVAAQNGSTGAIVYFKDKGLDINCRGRDGATPLMAAMYPRNLKTVETLLNLGADPKIKDNNENSPMSLVHSFSSRELYEVICSNGWPGAALHRAVRSGDSSAVSALLAKGEPIDAPNPEGETPLFVAISEGKSALVKLLLEKGADGSKHTAYGLTPLYLASDMGDLESVSHLLEKGVKPDVLVQGGDTAIGAALAGDHLKVVQALISAGASILYYITEKKHEIREVTISSNNRLKEIRQEGLDKGEFRETMSPFWLPTYRGGNAVVAGMPGVEVPIFKTHVSPNYPSEAIASRIQGTVILSAIMGSDGNIRNIKVLQGLGDGRYGFEVEAIKALKQWKYTPGRVNGKPCDVRMTLKVDFALVTK